MNDENFDKIFGDKLNKGKDFAFTDAKWNKMEKRLDAFHTAGRWRRFLFWSTLPLLALFGLLSWNSWALHQAHNEIYDLTQAVKSLRQEKLTPSVSTTKTSEKGQNFQQLPVFKSDTVYHHIVIKRYDTIFQTVVRRELSHAMPPQQGISTSLNNKKDLEMGLSATLNPSPNAQIIESKSILHNVLMPNKTVSASASTAKMAILENVLTPDTPIHQTAKIVENGYLALDKNDNTPKNDALKNILKTVLDSILKTEIMEKAVIQDSFNVILSDMHKVRIPQKMDSTTAKHPFWINVKKWILPTKKTEKIEESLEKFESAQKTKRLPIIKPVKMVGYEIGASGGLALIDDFSIIRQDGFAIGGSGGILLGERLKIVGEAHYLALSYDLDKITDKQDIPKLNPPSVNDEFLEVWVQQPYWQYALGVQYALTRTRLKPYIGLSIFGQTKLEEHFEYQFKNKLTKETIFIKTKRNEATFQMPFLRFKVGVEYPIFNKFKAQVEGSYDVTLGSSLQFKPLYQVKGTILYRF